MTRRVYLYFFITFILGAVIGGVGLYYYLWNSGHIQRPHGFNREHAINHLKQELNLNDSQVQKLGAIFDESERKMRDLQKQVDPQFQALHQETRAHIREILDPEQAKKFDESVKAIDARHRQHPPQGPPPPPPQ
jgi:Spy/CpxP family protein refolding chaperone